jgi:hypothetical protein
VTTLPITACPEEAKIRPVPWHRLGWVTWRQHRVALGGVAALLGVLALWLWFVGLQLHHAYAAAAACHPANSAACQNLVIGFDSTNVFLKGGFILQPLPALIGAFVGAPLLARELETGTFRYAWTQGFGRWRWALAKLVLLGIAVVAAAEAFSLLLSWYYQPYLAGNGSVSSSVSPLSPGLFDLRGVAFAGWTLAAFAIAALAGLLIRRVVPAIVTTLAAYTGLALLAGNVLRQHYQTPIVAMNSHLPNAAWITKEWWTKGGKFAFAGRPPLSLLPQLCPSSFAPGPGGAGGIRGLGSANPTQCLVQHGYTQWVDYQPASHFWSFQGIEGGWLLALSVLLIALTVWLVRRRVV